MAEGRSREAWNHTAAVMAILANVHRDPKKHGPYGADDFHPYRTRGREAVPKTKDLSILKAVFVDGKAGRKEA